MKFQLTSMSNKGLVILALCIIGVTLWYTNNLVQKLQIEEKKKS